MWLSEGDAAARYDAAMISSMYRYLLERGEAYIVEIRAAEAWVALGDAALCTDCIPIVIGVPEHRSRGLGSRVLRLLVTRARALGWRRIRVKGVYTYNPRTRRLYERAGFRLTGLRPAQGGQDAWTFDLLL